MYYSSIYGPHMIGGGAWQDALRESKKKHPGLNKKDRFNDARRILYGKKNINFEEDESESEQEIEESENEIEESENEEPEKEFEESENEEPENEIEEPENENKELKIKDLLKNESKKMRNILFSKKELQEIESKKMRDILFEDEPIDMDKKYNIYRLPVGYKQINLKELQEGNQKKYYYDEKLQPILKKGKKKEYYIEPIQDEPPLIEQIPEAPPLSDAPQIQDENIDRIPTIQEVENAERKYKLCKYNKLYKDCKEGKLYSGNVQYMQQPMYQNIPIRSENPEIKIHEQKINIPEKKIKVDINADVITRSIQETALRAREREERLKSGAKPIVRNIRQLTPEQIRERLSKKGKGLYGGSYVQTYYKSPLLFEDNDPALYEQMFRMTQQAVNTNHILNYHTPTNKVYLN